VSNRCWLLPGSPRPLTAEIGIVSARIERRDAAMLVEAVGVLVHISEVLERLDGYAAHLPGELAEDLPVPPL